MIEEFVKYWDKNKNKLQNYIETTEQDKYSNYIDLVKILFEIVINPEVEKEYNLKNITMIDNGDYQGTQIFLLFKDWYQPSIQDYIYTNVYYGSCCGCDTLMSIQGYGLPNKKQVEDYMMLFLHLLQRCKPMSDFDESESE